MTIGDLHKNREPDRTLEGSRQKIISEALAAYPGRSLEDALILSVMRRNGLREELTELQKCNARQAGQIARLSRAHK